MTPLAWYSLATLIAFGLAMLVVSLAMDKPDPPDPPDEDDES